MQLLLVVLLAGSAHVRWAPSWSDALTEARVLNLPVVVHRHGFF